MIIKHYYFGIELFKLTQILFDLKVITFIICNISKSSGWAHAILNRLSLTLAINRTVANSVVSNTSHITLTFLIMNFNSLYP